jgi:hypothetical protein
MNTPCNCGSGFTVCRREPFVCGNLSVENKNAEAVQYEEAVRARFCEDDDEIFPEFKDWYEAREQARLDEATGWEACCREAERLVQEWSGPGYYAQGCQEDL